MKHEPECFFKAGMKNRPSTDECWVCNVARNACKRGQLEITADHYRKGRNDASADIYEVLTRGDIALTWEFLTEVLTVAKGTK